MGQIRVFSGPDSSLLPRRPEQGTHPASASDIGTFALQRRVLPFRAFSATCDGLAVIVGQLTPRFWTFFRATPSNLDAHQ